MNKHSNRLAVAFAVTFLCSASAVAGTALITITRISSTIDGKTYIAASPVPKNTCSTTSGESFKFDATTPGGKTIQATLLSAKLTNKKVTLWWSEIPANLFGSTNCGEPELAQVSSIAIE